MNLTLSFLIPALMFFAAVIGLGTYVTVLIVKALRRYTRAEPNRKEKKKNTRRSVSIKKSLKSIENTNFIDRRQK